MQAAAPPAASGGGGGSAIAGASGAAAAALNPAAAEWRPAPAPAEAAPSSAEAAPPAGREKGGRGRGRGGGREAGGGAARGRGGRGRGERAPAPQRPPAPPPPPRAPSPAPPEVDAAAASGAAGRRRAAAANHLLNFSYAAPARAGPPPAASRQRTVSSHASAPSSVARLRADRQRKDLFLQAHFRFVLLDAAARRLPAAGAAACADTMASWEDVVSVEAATEAPPACPICLEDAPLPAPQITPCGHAFCFPCIARHLALNPGRNSGVNHRGGGCPMCFAPVQMGELRRLAHAATSPPAAGRVAAFTLMARARDSLVPRPAPGGGGDDDDVAVGGAASVTWPRASREGRACRWAKFSLTSDEDGAAAADLAHLEAAAAAAMERSAGAEAAQALPALSAAMDALKARAAAWAARRAELADDAAAADVAERAAAALAKLSLQRAPQPQQPQQPGRADGAWESDGEDAAADTDAAETAAADVASSADVVSTPSADVAPARDPDEAAAEAALLEGLGRGGDGDSAPDARASASAAESASTNGGDAPGSDALGDSFVFYLSSDGGFATLHPCTVRALLAGCGGSYDALPRRVSATVAAAERGVVSDATRRRLRFLGHLPLRAPFTLAELSLEELGLPPAALAAHAPEAAARARKRAAAERAAAVDAARARRAAEQQQAAHAAAAAALRAAAASIVAERMQDAAMPPLPQRHSADVPMAASPPTQPGGVSFARVADLGYASGLNAPGLMLASSPPGAGGAAWPLALSPPMAPAPVAPGPRPAWGPRAAAVAAPEAGDGGAAPGKKGKGKATTLLSLSSTSTRRY